MKELTGQRFGRLTVVRSTDSRDRKNVVWECKCDCGNMIFVRTNLLTNGNTSSCGCLRTEKRSHTKDLAGQRFGKLVAIKPTGDKAKYGVVWECQCDCGNIAFVSSDKLLRSGHAQSCGCLLKTPDFKRERTSESNTGNKGVSLTNGRYFVSISMGNKNPRYLGTFDNLDDAVKQRKAAEDLLSDSKYFERWNRKSQDDPEWAKNNPIDIKLQRNGANDYSLSLVPEL